MKKLLLLALFYFSFIVVYCQNIPPNTTYLGKDSMPYNFEENWKFYESDSKNFAARDYDDSKWVIKDCELGIGRNADSHWFKGIGWFRLNLLVDSSWTKQTMALKMSHFGASEIYLDGKLIKSFGKINGKDSSKYFDPQNIPFLITFDTAGKHIIAVRYANYKANYNRETFWTQFTGFTMSINKADEMIFQSVTSRAAVTFIYTLLMGIFLALALLHLFLYLYYRNATSNLYFSLFAFCFAGMFFIAFLKLVVTTPLLSLKAGYMVFPLACTAAFALSGFIHQLFYKKGKIIFYSIAVIYLLSVLLPLFGWGWASYISFVLIFGVSIEAIIMIIISIRRKVKGAKIIGFGFLFFVLFLLSIFTIGLIFGDVDISDNSIAGLIFGILTACAVLSTPISMSVYLAWNFSSVNKNLALQLDNVKLLSKKSLEQEQEKLKLITEQNAILEQKVEERTTDLKAEKKKSDDLLLNILPAEIAEELKNKGETAARHFDMVSVLFTDFVNFTGISSSLSPTELVKEIDICFKAFDGIIEKNGLEKIKTIGDAYLAVCGMPETDKNHAIKVVNAAIDIKNFVAERKKNGGKFEIRLGIHSGPLVAGIVGVKKFAYDIWGDTVNLASRMESNSESGKINISESTYQLIKDQFNFTPRGKIEVKNKGMIEMYYVD